MQRREIRDLAIAALVQADTRRVEEDLTLVLHNGKPDLIGCARLRHPAEAVFLAEACDRRLFHDGLTIRHGVQLAVQTVALDGEGPVLRDEALEREGLDALKQIFKAHGAEMAKADHHALAHAAAEVDLCQIGKVSRKKYAPVFDADALAAEPLQLVAHEALQPEQTRYAEFQIFHLSNFAFFAASAAYYFLL